MERDKLRMTLEVFHRNLHVQAELTKRQLDI